MNIYKLNYTDKKTAIADLILKDVLFKNGNYRNGIHAVVEIGKIVLTNGTYDKNLKELTAPIFADGYAYDIMSEQKIDFGANEIFPKSPNHEFAI
jgi:hypothetical protein